MLRFLGVEYPLIYRADFYRGASLAPGAEGWIRKEGEAYVKINSGGLRDNEHTVAKRNGMFRVAVLGDSYVAALQVSLEDTFWYKLERMLSSCPAFAGQEVEVLNFGVPGYSTAQELITLRQHVWTYSPDLILLAFTQGNDIEDNSRNLTDKTYRPFFFVENGVLVEDFSFRQSEYFMRSVSDWVAVKIWIINRVRILQLLQFVKDNIDIQVDNQHDQEVNGLEKGFHPSVYNEPKTEPWIEAWEVTEKLIEKIDQEVREEGRMFVLVTLSTPRQVHPDPEAMNNFKEKKDISNLLYPDERLKRFAQEKNINILNLARPMQSYAQKNNVFLHGFPNTKMGDGHWNESGHQLAAELISTYLCERPGIQASLSPS